MSWRMKWWRIELERGYAFRSWPALAPSSVVPRVSLATLSVHVAPADTIYAGPEVPKLWHLTNLFRIEQNWLFDRRTVSAFLAQT